MSDSRTRIYGGETAGARASRRRRALVDAAFALIALDGWRELRIERLCVQAQLNKRYFYESFSSLDELAAAVIDDVVTEITAALSAPVNRSVALSDATFEVIAALVHHLTDDPRRAHVLFGEMSSTEAVTQHRRGAIRQITTLVARQGQLVYDVRPEELPASELAASMIVGGAIQAILDWLDGYIHLSQDEFIHYLAAFWDLTGAGARNYVRRRLADDAG